MAVNQTLETLWSDVADAIRGLDLTEAPIEVGNFGDSIESIEILIETPGFVIYVDAPPSSTITLTKGQSTYTGVTDEDGHCKILVPEIGVYSYSGETSTGEMLGLPLSYTIYKKGKYFVPLEHSNPTPLSVARYDLAAASIGDYALFAGGVSYSSSTIFHDTVDAYDTNLVRSSPQVLSGSRSRLGAASNKKYGIFAGGSNGSASSTVNAYNDTLVRTTPTSLNIARYNLKGCKIGIYAVFIGGQTQASTGRVGTVDAYNASLTRSNPTAIPVTYSTNGGVTPAQNYCILAGFSASDGNNAGNADVVKAYDPGLNIFDLSPLSQMRLSAMSVSLGDYAIFAGGLIAGLTGKESYSNVVDVYNILTKITPLTLPKGRGVGSATTIGSYALIGGGTSYTNLGDDVVDVFDSNLTRTTATPLKEKRKWLVATPVGDYALFGGGGISTANYFDVVDAYHA